MRDSQSSDPPAGPRVRDADVIVVGCGVIGMTAALRLAERGHRVRIWTRDDPRATTSAAAGAIWYPYLAEPRERVRRWSAATFTRLLELVDLPAAGVAMVEVLEVFAEDPPDLWWADAVPDVERLSAGEVPAGYAAAVRSRVPVVDVPRHLDWLLAELGRRGVAIERREIQTFDEAFSVAGVVVNCTGLGARALCRDDDLHAVRGQVLTLTGIAAQRAWIDDTTPRPCYLIPRGRDLVVGGTAQVGDERLIVDDADSAAIVAAAARALPSIVHASCTGAKVGLRPCRSTVRLEAEYLPADRLLVHDYGHGGSGYTLAWGCADEVVRLVAG